ncbi:hypothetical protein AB1Y20_019094 [Prymnesium parvum]|uniref:Uncharacterized protein n=1 Tax=Prymnesium parvum TaxID=97485 RepID=A0AB34JT89_PRYPA
MRRRRGYLAERTVLPQEASDRAKEKRAQAAERLRSRRAQLEAGAAGDGFVAGGDELGEEWSNGYGVTQGGGDVHHTHPRRGVFSPLELDDQPWGANCWAPPTEALTVGFKVEGSSAGNQPKPRQRTQQPPVEPRAAQGCHSKPQRVREVVRPHRDLPQPPSPIELGGRPNWADGLQIGQVGEEDGSQVLRVGSPFVPSVENALCQEVHSTQVSVQQQHVAAPHSPKSDEQPSQGSPTSTVAGRKKKPVWRRPAVPLDRVL